MVEQQSHPLLFQYLKKYQDDPKSRVFAPLAEAYRKAGLIEEAIEIASEGLQSHPHFVGGKVALARALFDKKQYEDVLNVLNPVVQDVPDNLVAQRLVAESNLILGRSSEALGAYKMLLYFSPQDEETAKVVRELEAQSLEDGSLLVQEERAQGFDIRPAESAIDSDPELKKARWMGKIEKLQQMLQAVERYRARRKENSPH